MSKHGERSFDTRIGIIHELLDDGSGSRSWRVPIGKVHLVTEPADVKEAYHREHFGRPNFMAQVGGDGLEGPPHFRWSVGFGIVGFKVAGGSIQPILDHRRLLESISARGLG